MLVDVNLPEDRSRKHNQWYSEQLVEPQYIVVFSLIGFRNIDAERGE